MSHLLMKQRVGEMPSFSANEEEMHAHVAIKNTIITCFSEKHFKLLIKK